MNSFLKQIGFCTILLAIIVLGLVLFFAKQEEKSVTLKSYPWNNGELFARNDYRIFACGEELFLKASSDSAVAKGEGLYAESVSGSIVARGTPKTYDNASLPAFFEAIGGGLYHSGSMMDK